MSTPTPLAYSVKDAAAACGYSIRTMWNAIEADELVLSYANRKGVILATELTRWLESLPAEPRKNTRT